MANLQQIFNKILIGEKLCASFSDKREFDAARTSLLRKFRDHKNALDKIGADNPYEGQYLRCVFSKATTSGTFFLEDERRKVGLAGKVYSVTEL
jgi:hypothetical protein